MELKPFERLIVWKLMLLGDGLMMKDLPGSFTVKMRQRLCDKGLISVEKKGRAKIIRLNEENAWSWAVQNLDSEISKRAFFAGEVLQKVFSRLQGFMKTKDIALAELLGSELEDSEPVDLEQQIKSAYLSTSGRKWNNRVRIAQLKKNLPEMNNHQIDSVLKKMQMEKKIHLYPFDDPLECTKDDESAAVKFSGEAFTLIYIEES